MSKNEKHDAYIFKYYKIKTKRQIAKDLGITKGGVVTRYAIMTGKRKGNNYNTLGLTSWKRPHEYKEPGMPKIRMENLDE